MLKLRQIYQRFYVGPAGAADRSRVLVDDLLTNMFSDLKSQPAALTVRLPFTLRVSAFMCICMSEAIKYSNGQ